MTFRRPRFPAKLTALAKLFQHSEKGVSGIEFAFCAPVLLILMAGGYDMSLRSQADRNGKNAASTLASLMGNENQWTKSDVDDLLAGGAWISRSIDASDVKVAISVLDVQSDGNLKVTASRALNRSPLQVGVSPPVDVPSNIQESGTSIILTQVDFSIRTPFSDAWPFYTEGGEFKISNYYLQRPRRGGNVVIN